jgi:hypothetical protein
VVTFLCTLEPGIEDMLVVGYSALIMQVYSSLRILFVSCVCTHFLSEVVFDVEGVNSKICPIIVEEKKQENY